MHKKRQATKKPVLVALGASLLLAFASACGSGTPSPSSPTPGGSTPAPTTTKPAVTTVAEETVQAGKALFVSKGCVACHTVQGFSEAVGELGPELTHQAENPQIAGILPNTRENLKKWLKDPPAVKPETIMPNQNLTDSEINALVAFLETLR